MGKPDMQDWCDEKAGYWDAAIQGPSDLRAALLSMALDETSAKLKCTSYGTVYLDLEKLCDSVGPSVLITRAVQLNYPGANLYISMLMYLSPRLVRACQDHAAPISLWNGI
eukprot:7303733-Pyramimonas_sp.AAC.1